MLSTLASNDRIKDFIEGRGIEFDEMFDISTQRKREQDDAEYRILMTNGLPEFCVNEPEISRPDRLLELLQTNYHDPLVMEEAECAVNTFIQGGRKMTLIWKEGLDVFITAKDDLEGFYVGKRLIDEEDDDNNTVIHEVFIGVMAMNKMRIEFPNFFYTYGGMISEESFYKRVLFTEYIRNAPPLSDYIMDKNPDEIINLYLQVLLALQMAYEDHDFTHYDLHSNNVLVRDLPEGKDTIRYVLDGKCVFLPVNKVATVIDFGMSHITYEGKHYGNQILYAFGINSDKSYPFYDSYRLFMDMMYRMTMFRLDVAFDNALLFPEYLRQSPAELGINVYEPIYKFFYDDEIFVQNIFRHKNWYHSLPDDPELTKIDHRPLIYFIAEEYEIDLFQPNEGNVMNCTERCFDEEELDEYLN